MTIIGPSFAPSGAGRGRKRRSAIATGHQLDDQVVKEEPRRSVGSAAPTHRG